MTMMMVSCGEPFLPELNCLSFFSAGWLLPDKDVGPSLWILPWIRKVTNLDLKMWNLSFRVSVARQITLLVQFFSSPCLLPSHVPFMVEHASLTFDFAPGSESCFLLLVHGQEWHRARAKPGPFCALPFYFCHYHRRDMPGWPTGCRQKVRDTCI